MPDDQPIEDLRVRATRARDGAIALLAEPKITIPPAHYSADQASDWLLTVDRLRQDARMIDTWLARTEHGDTFERPAAWEEAVTVATESLEVLISVYNAVAPALQDPAAPPQQGRKTKRPVSSKIPQLTFQEMRNLGSALADAPSGRRWVHLAGEDAMVHAIPDQPLHVRFSPSEMMLAWWSGPSSYTRMRDELRQAGAPAVLLAHVAVGLVLEQGKVTISLDDLRRAIGWTRREASLIDEQRRRVWRMLMLLSSMPVVGKRPGTYRDPKTRETVDLVSRDPFIVVRGERYAPGSPTAQDVPLDVSIDGGAWIDQHHGNRGILTDFGDVLRLAAIPAGKPAGAWAQSIGLALNQRWREGAADATIARVGDDAHETVRFRQSFTRRDLLDIFRTEPYYQDVLNGANPSRAREYWEAAIGLLKTEGVIGHYAERKPLPAKRQGWQAPWLVQPLDICPAAAGRRAVEEISQAARASAAKAKRPRQQSRA
jgi:hypothetical protein